MGARFVMVVVIASSIRASRVANRMNFNLQSNRILNMTSRIGSRKQYMSVPPAPIQSRIKPHPMPRTARIFGLLQVTTVTADVVNTSQTARTFTKITRAFFTFQTNLYRAPNARYIHQGNAPDRKSVVQGKRRDH